MVGQPNRRYNPNQKTRVVYWRTVEELSIEEIKKKFKDYYDLDYSPARSTINTWTGKKKFREAAEKLEEKDEKENSESGGSDSEVSDNEKTDSGEKSQQDETEETDESESEDEPKNEPEGEVQVENEEGLSRGSDKNGDGEDEMTIEGTNLEETAKNSDIDEAAERDQQEREDQESKSKSEANSGGDKEKNEDSGGRWSFLSVEYLKDHKVEIGLFVAVLLGAAIFYGSGGFTSEGNEEAGDQTGPGTGGGGTTVEDLDRLENQGGNGFE